MHHAPEPDSALRAAFARGEPEACERIAHAFYDDVARFCRALCEDPERAGDAVQETFLRLIERHRLYNAARPFRPWLFAVARNAVRMGDRGHRGESARVISLDDEDTAIPDLLTDARRSVVEQAFLAEEEDAVMGCLRRLPESQRLVVTLHLFEGLTFREVAEASGLPAATAATTYYRAIKRMRRELSPAAEARLKGETSHVR